MEARKKKGIARDVAADQVGGVEGVGRGKAGCSWVSSEWGERERGVGDHHCELLANTVNFPPPGPRRRQQLWRHDGGHRRRRRDGLRRHPHHRGHDPPGDAGLRRVVHVCGVCGVRCVSACAVGECVSSACCGCASFPVLTHPPTRPTDDPPCTNQIPRSSRPTAWSPRSSSCASPTACWSTGTARSTSRRPARWGGVCLVYLISLLFRLSLSALRGRVEPTNQHSPTNRPTASIHPPTPHNNRTSPRSPPPAPRPRRPLGSSRAWRCSPTPPSAAGRGPTCKRCGGGGGDGSCPCRW